MLYAQHFVYLWRTNKNHGCSVDALCQEAVAMMLIAILAAMGANHLIMCHRVEVFLLLSDTQEQKLLMYR